MAYRIGIGYDIHKLVKGRKLFLGGINIPYHKGLLGYSDADVLLHAICDALLGAAGVGDIGEYFADSDPKYKGIASKLLLEKVAGILKRKKIKIINIDSIVIAQEPNLSAFKKKIREKVSSILGISSSCVNIKAKTNEGIGQVGKKCAICAFAVAAINRR
jgi:2-C-methyl-D-erythritol 2,4-cyclodiphosphate synthase